MEPESSLPCSQGTTTGSPILSQMNPIHTPQIYFFKDPF
jgi:hypothetical protein